MGKPTKSQIISSYQNFDVNDLYQELAAEGTETIINRCYQGAALPDEPEANPVEIAIQQSAHEIFAQEIVRLEVEKGEPKSTVKDVQISSDKADEVLNSLCTDLHQIKQDSMDDCHRVKEALMDKKNALEAFKCANHIHRPVQTGSKGQAVALTALFFGVDSGFNGLQLFSSNVLPGGLFGAVAISGLVSAINTFSGYLTGEYIWRNLLKVNASKWRSTAWGVAVFILMSVLACNGLFAYFRAFGGTELALLNADSSTYLNFLGVFFIGCIVFGWVTVKWNRTNDPNIKYGNLHCAIRKEEEQMKHVRQKTMENITEWKTVACDELDELIQSERKDYVNADEAFDDCLQLHDEIETSKSRIQHLYEVVISLHRATVAGCQFEDLPSYFQEKPEINLQTNTVDLNALKTHVDTLENNLAQLEKRVQEHKQYIHATTDKATQDICISFCLGG